MQVLILFSDISHQKSGQRSLRDTNFWLHNKSRDNFLITTDIAYYNWCIIKIVSMMRSCENDIALVTTCHLNKFCEKSCP